VVNLGNRFTRFTTRIVTRTPVEWVNKTNVVNLVNLYTVRMTEKIKKKTSCILYTRIFFIYFPVDERLQKFTRFTTYVLDSNSYTCRVG
jgi:hypothetical protein